MAKADEISIALPAEVVACARTLAKDASCTVGELVGEALHRYQEAGRLMTAIESGADRLEALEEFLNDYVVRMVHDFRAERRAQTLHADQGERVAS
jgi:hypothetical protein